MSVLLKILRRGSTKSGYSRRELLRDVSLDLLTDGALFFTGCASISRQISLVEILNNPNSSSSEYEKAVEQWGDRQIWYDLRSHDAKIRFVKYLLQNKEDETNYVPYWKDKHYAEIDPEHPFVCKHLARKMYYTFRDAAIEWKPDHERYSIKRAEKKLRIPIREVNVLFGSRLLMRDDHAVNAVYLGENEKCVDNWIFFEPQNNEIIFRSSRSLWTYSINFSPSKPVWICSGNLFSVQPDHNVPLDKECRSPVGDPDWSNADKVLSFYVKKDGKVMYVKSLAHPGLTRAIYEGKYPVVFNNIDSYGGESGRMADVIIETARASGNFSSIQIQSLNDWKKVSYDANSGLEYDAWFYVKSFLLERDTYFDKLTTEKWRLSRDRNRKMYRIAFDYMNRLGILKGEEYQSINRILD
ncbi:MAG: hypothetical protein ACW98D_19175 [Promethearchaeota archaeon]|jgi:hypothetical protein